MIDSRFLLLIYLIYLRLFDIIISSLNLSPEGLLELVRLVELLDMSLLLLLGLHEGVVKSQFIEKFLLLLAGGFMELVFILDCITEMLDIPQ